MRTANDERLSCLRRDKLHFVFYTKTHEGLIKTVAVMATVFLSTTEILSFRFLHQRSGFIEKSVSEEHCH